MWRRVALAVCLVLTLACRGDVFGTPKHPDRVIHRERSLYVNIIVNETADSRCMKFGGPERRQSCLDLRDPRSLVLAYTRNLFAAFLAVPKPRRVLVIGLGGGLVPTAIRDIDADAQVDVVELDPAVVRVAERYFGFRQDARMRAYVDDGRVFVRKQRRRQAQYDLVMIDAFEKSYIPEHMLTREFMAEVRSLLAPGGVVAANTFGAGALQRYELATYQSVFGAILSVEPKTADHANNRILIVGRDGPPALAAMRRNAPALATRLAAHGISVDDLLSRLRTQPRVSDVRPLTDQYSPANLLLTY